MATSLTPEEIQAAFDQFNTEFNRTGKVSKETAEAFADAKAGIKNYTYQLNLSLKQLGTSMLNFGESLKDGKQGASVYNDSIQAGADAIDAFAAKFGILGRIIGGLATAGARYVVEVNKQSDKLFESYQSLSKFGAASASGMSGVFQSMQDFGYNIEQLGDFGNLIKQNAESLALMSGTVNQGTRVFTDVAKGIQRSGLQTEFLRMGMTVNDINSGMGGYLRIQTLTGAAQRKTTGELTQGAAEYIKNLDLLSKLTGKNAETIQQEREARMMEQRFVAVQMELEDKAAQARLAGNEAQAKAFETQKALNDELIDRAPTQELKTAIIGAMTGFAGTNKEAEKLLRTAPVAFQAIARQSGEAPGAILDMIGTEGQQRRREFTGLGKVGGFDDVFIQLGSINKLRKDNLEQEKIAAEEAKDQRKNLDKATEAQVGLRQEQMEATRALQTFINQGVNRTTRAMSNLSGAIETVTSKIPGTGTTTGTTGTGRGNEAVGGTASMVNQTTTILNQAGQVVEQRQGGNRNWRNNNPGNIEYGPFAISMGATGSDGRFAIFPTMDMGYKAADALMKGKNYQNLSIADAIKRWAPPNENDTRAYQQRFQAAGFDLNKRYSDLSPVEQRRYLETKMMVEGGKAGTVTAGPGGTMSGPVDRYASSLRNVDTNIASAQASTETSSAINNARNQNDLIVIQIAKMDELIGLMKANNSINSKILQRARN